MDAIHFINRFDRAERERRRYGEPMDWIGPKLFVQKQQQVYANVEIDNQALRLEWYWTAPGHCVVHAFYVKTSSDQTWRSEPTSADYEQALQEVRERLDAVDGPSKRRFHIFVHSNHVPLAVIANERKSMSERRLRYCKPMVGDLDTFWHRSLDTVVENCYLGLLIACDKAQISDRDRAEEALDAFGLACVNAGMQCELVHVYAIASFTHCQQTCRFVSRTNSCDIGGPLC